MQAALGIVAAWLYDMKGRLMQIPPLRLTFEMGVFMFPILYDIHH